MSERKRKLKDSEKKDQTMTNKSMAKNDIKEIEKEEALFNAAESGDYKKIAELLSLGVSVEGENYEKGLHYLCKNHHMTPLLVAAANGHVKCVQILTANGANVNAKGKNDITAVHLVTDNGGNYESLITLLTAGANCSVPIRKSAFKRKVLYIGGTTPLHIAAKNNNVKFVEVLIQFGADCNAVDERGHTSLYIAARSGFEECVLTILRDSRSLVALSLPSFDTSETPLHHAVTQRMVKGIKKMVHLGSDVNHMNRYGFSPLQLFIATHREKCDHEMELLKLLVLDGYNANVNTPTNVGRTPLDFALMTAYWDPEFMAFLINYGAKSLEMSAETFLSYQLSMPLSHNLLKCFVRTMPQVPRLKSVFPTLVTKYPLVLHSPLEYKISSDAGNLYIEVIDHEISYISERLGQNCITEPLPKYVTYPLEQPYLDAVYERLVEKLNEEDTVPVLHLRDYFKDHLLIIKKRLWYEKIASVPLTLQHCCRLSIRKCLNPCRLKYVRKLPVPEKIASYLLFESDK